MSKVKDPLLREALRRWKRNRVPMLVLDPVRESLVSSSGGVLLRRTIELSGLACALSAALSPWRSGRAAHDPGKVLLDVATAVALGGDCLADVAVVRAQPEVFGSVASDPMVSRLVAALAGDVKAAVADQINPVAVQAMAEDGIDIATATPKVLTTEAVQEADVVITMGCGDACTYTPGKRYEDWKLDDPAGQAIDRGAPHPRRHQGSGPNPHR